MAVVLKKDKTFEFLYLKDVVMYYASVQEPKKKYTQPAADAKNQSTHEFAVTVFVSQEDRDKLEDSVMINKQLFEVAVDKNKKRKIKYPLKNDQGEPMYADVEGLHGLQLTLNNLNSKGKENSLVVVDKEGKPLDSLVGNGSRGNIKCFGYRNQDDQLVVALNIVQVTDLVAYEGGGSGRIVDDELGIDVEAPEEKQAKAVKEEFEEPPFNTDEEDF